MRSLALPWWAILALAALAVPRVLIHDLGVETGTFIQGLLTIGPPAVWVGVAVWRRLPSPVVTLVVIGTVYGVALGVSHNLMWDTAFSEESPALGGNLAGTLSAGAEEALMRVATMFSSVFTGALVGLIAGLVAQVLASLPGRRR